MISSLYHLVCLLFCGLPQEISSGHMIQRLLYFVSTPISHSAFIFPRISCLQSSYTAHSRALINQSNHWLLPVSLCIAFSWALGLFLSTKWIVKYTTQSSIHWENVSLTTASYGHPRRDHCAAAVHFWIGSLYLGFLLYHLLNMVPSTAY